MNQFLEYLEGTFSNKRQAQGHPTRYAHIRVIHRKISDRRFYGEQAYNYLLNRPYRQFVIDVVVEKGQFRLKNYEIEDPKRFVGGQNLELITDEILTYREGCDIIMNQTGPHTFYGGTSVGLGVDLRGKPARVVQITPQPAPDGFSTGEPQVKPQFDRAEASPEWDAPILVLRDLSIG